MTPKALSDRISALAERVVGDTRWLQGADDLAVAVFGMLLYGYAMAAGRTIMLLDAEEINAAVTKCLIVHLGLAPNRAAALADEAARSTFDESYHPGQYELVAVGHQYVRETDLDRLVANVFANIDSVRKRAQGSFQCRD